MRALMRLALATLVAAVPFAAVVAAHAADDPTPITVLTSDFEDGTVQGWAGRSAETLAASATVAHGGTRSLSITGRTATWQGPSLSVLDTFEKGTSYTISAWVRMAEGSDNARLSVERRTAGTATYETVVGNTAVTSGGWVNLTGRYTLATDVDFLSVYIETASTTGSFYLDDVTASYVPALPIQTDIPAVKSVVTEFPVGAAITGAEIIGTHGDLLARHFTSVTPGNALKWDATEPTENAFTYTQADPLIAFATAHGMKVRGHTLVWHNQTPAWVFANADKATLLARLENHIRNVAAHYGTTIGVWDVVNEVIDESQSDGMRRSTWYTVTGLDYIRTAFRVAREVAPAAKLCINDYNTNVAAKRDALYNLVVQLKGEGVPIDCVGHQMHVNVSWPSIADTEAMLKKFQGIGVEQQITEMDVSIYTSSGESFPTPPADRLLAQAYMYRDMFALFRRYAADVTSVTLWGLADDNTWLDTYPVARKDAPLLFDTRLQAKSAYWGVVDPTKIGTSPSPSASTSTSPSPSASTGTSPSPSASTGTSASCAVTYRVTGSWTGGFQADVKIANTGATAISGWKLGWQFTGGQTVSQLWNGSVTQSGSAVTVTNAAWNGALPAGGSASVGFLGSWTGSNPVPSAFTVNGTACAVL
ncbi:endo-1,4-beta-xylanase [Actinoplanes awajinensis]|uniref:Beta-xylanase n=1 Tax=Actinoplanes awajinensis subsp. mycoplanecinus TaxID=135947 RepID=A0A101JJ93_9ACTN|nr:endo-1,4-beta-xylanase [Actinoplanes awajinensis]KUL27905.1 glycosyl hydrolase [Actinoplanes awajinensis subsp. mycoplanecinus]